MIASQVIYRYTIINPHAHLRISVLRFETKTGYIINGGYTCIPNYVV